MTRIAIHEFGRTGRSLLRVALENELFVPASISDIRDASTSITELNVLPERPVTVDEVNAPSPRPPPPRR